MASMFMRIMTGRLLVVNHTNNNQFLQASIIEEPCFDFNIYVNRKVRNHGSFLKLIIVGDD